MTLLVIFMQRFLVPADGWRGVRSIEPMEPSLATGLTRPQSNFLVSRTTRAASFNTRCSLSAPIVGAPATIASREVIHAGRHGSVSQPTCQCHVIVGRVLFVEASTMPLQAQTLPTCLSSKTRRWYRVAVVTCVHDLIVVNLVAREAIHIILTPETAPAALSIAFG